jgi:beta-lactamase regulating signal transducer with metallopeptidase domain
MHPLLASTALGLVAAWPVGALGFGLGRLVERLTDDPRPRAAAWSLAYALPAGALAATVALTFSPVTTTSTQLSPAIVPGPVRMVIADVTDIPAPPTAAHKVAPAPVRTSSPLLRDSLAWGLIGLSAAGLMTRGLRWNRGRRRLAAIRAAAEPCQDAVLIEAVRDRAARLGVKAPRIRISAEIGEPLLAGARRRRSRPAPWAAGSSGDARLALVCAHELAHLRRGDNWRIPAEEALAGLFWITPPVAALRGRMLAARETVCDFTALDGAAPEARRDYARVLVEALRMNAQPSVQSAFTGRDRNLASLRLTAILQPRGRASAGRVGLVFALGGALTAATGAGSLALADQARRIAPPASAETTSLAKAVTLLAHADAVATPDDSVISAEKVHEAEAQITQADEAAAAAPAAPAAEALPAAPAAAAMAALAPAAPAAAVAPLAMAAPRPDPHPDPRPNPQPKPDPKPDPRPNSRVARRTISASVNQQQAEIDVTADNQQNIPSKGMTVFTGGVTVRGELNPVLVTVKLNGRVAPAGFMPTTLATGAIQRLEFTDRTVNVDGKMMLNVVLNDPAP